MTPAQVKWMIDFVVEWMGMVMIEIEVVVKMFVVGKLRLLFF